MINVEVHITNAAEISQKLEKLGESLYMMDAAMATIGKDLSTYFATIAFNSQGGVYSNVWVALNDAYALWKAKKLGTPILVGTSIPHMRDSFTFESTSTSVYVTNTSDHFEFHQLGTSKLPQRQMIGVNDDVRGIINDIINEDIKQKIESA